MIFVKHFISAFAMFGLVLSTSAIAKEDVPETLDGTTKVTAEKLIELMQSKSDLVVIDSRKPSDRAKGHIEGSLALPNTDTNEGSLAKHLKSKATPVAFYCNGVKCGRSVAAAKIAISHGYSEIYWFRGGWDEWTSKGLPVMK